MLSPWQLERHESLQCARAWPMPTEPCSTQFSTLRGERRKRKSLDLITKWQALWPLQPLQQALQLNQRTSLCLYQSPLHTKWKNRCESAHLVRDKTPTKKGKEELDETGYSETRLSWEQEEEEAEFINTAVTTQSLSSGELQDMQKDFSCHPVEHIVTWLLWCWDEGASSLELEGRGAQQLGSLSSEGGIDKVIRKGAQAYLDPRGTWDARENNHKRGKFPGKLLCQFPMGSSPASAEGTLMKGLLICIYRKWAKNSMTRTREPLSPDRLRKRTTVFIGLCGFDRLIRKTNSRIRFQWTLAHSIP